MGARVPPESASANGNYESIIGNLCTFLTSKQSCCCCSCVVCLVQKGNWKVVTDCTRLWLLPPGAPRITAPTVMAVNMRETSAVVVPVSCSMSNNVGPKMPWNNPCKLHEDPALNSLSGFSTQKHQKTGGSRLKSKDILVNFLSSEVFEFWSREFRICCLSLKQNTRKSGQGGRKKNKIFQKKTKTKTNGNKLSESPIQTFSDPKEFQLHFDGNTANLKRQRKQWVLTSVGLRRVSVGWNL